MKKCLVCHAIKDSSLFANSKSKECKSCILRAGLSCRRPISEHKGPTAPLSEHQKLMKVLADEDFKQWLNKVGITTHNEPFKLEIDLEWMNNKN